MTSIDILIEEAKSYLGVPWRHQGRSRSGVDCVGFLVQTWKKLGIQINDAKGYSRNPDGVNLKKLLDEQPSIEEVLDRKPRIGDILLFRIRKHPQHVALVIPSNTADLGMIHAFNGGTKQVVQHDLADYWKKRIVSVYRLKEECLS